MTRAQVIARFCALQAEVAHNVIGYSTANDCFCLNPDEGGNKPSSARDFRSDGTALAWIERVVRAELTRLSVAVGEEEKEPRP